MEIDVLKGKIIKKIDFIKNQSEENIIVFTISDEEKYIMGHYQSCCESVVIEDICGDIYWLIDSPVLVAEKRSNCGELLDDHTYTWTFYEIATFKGNVTIRWYGSSNGYYSEEVDFQRMEEE